MLNSFEGMGLWGGWGQKNTVLHLFGWPKIRAKIGVKFVQPSVELPVLQEIRASVLCGFSFWRMKYSTEKNKFCSKWHMIKYLKSNSCEIRAEIYLQPKLFYSIYAYSGRVVTRWSAVIRTTCLYSYAGQFTPWWRYWYLLSNCNQHLHLFEYAPQFSIGTSYDKINEKYR